MDFFNLRKDESQDEEMIKSIFMTLVLVLLALFFRKKAKDTNTSLPQTVPGTTSAIPIPPPLESVKPSPHSSRSLEKERLRLRKGTEGKQKIETCLDQLKEFHSSGKRLKKIQNANKTVEVRQIEEKFSIKVQLRPVRKSEPNASPGKDDTGSDTSRFTVGDGYEQIMRLSQSETSQKYKTVEASTIQAEKPEESFRSWLEEAHRKMKRVTKSKKENIKKDIAAPVTRPPTAPKPGMAKKVKSDDKKEVSNSSSDPSQIKYKEVKPTEQQSQKDKDVTTWDSTDEPEIIPLQKNVEVGEVHTKFDQTNKAESVQEATSAPHPPPPSPVPYQNELTGTRKSPEVEHTTSTFSSSSSFNEIKSSNGTETSFSYTESSVKENIVKGQRGSHDNMDSRNALLEAIKNIGVMDTPFLKHVVPREQEKEPEVKGLMHSVIKQRYHAWNGDSESEDCWDEWNEEEAEE